MKLFVLIDPGINTVVDWLNLSSIIEEYPLSYKVSI